MTFHQPLLSNKNPWGEENPSSPPPELDDFLKKGQEKFKKIFPGKPSGKTTPPFGAGILFVALFIMLALWLFTGFYVVQPDEEGVVLRFGQYHRTSNDGLNYHLPSPIETVDKVKTTTINQEEIGFRSSATGRSNDTPQRSIPEESLMLTGDENIADVYCVVQWRITNAKNYLFNVRDLQGENTVRAVTESAMREVIGRTPIVDAIGGSRARIESEAKSLLQNVLDGYNAGIQIVRLQLLKVDPPLKVIDAFRDVQTARADKEREINQAEAYRNDIIPRARGDAEKIIQSAQAYEHEIVARAEGEADRFNSVYEQYISAKDITKKRIYFETLEKILQDTQKIILDTGAKGQNVLPYVPLTELLQKKKSLEENKG